MIGCRRPGRARLESARYLAVEIFCNDVLRLGTEHPPETDELPCSPFWPTYLSTELNYLQI